ncbi:hypothetical protein CLV97_103112 [Planifilum fimeticola]|uniref:Uncharacterized protein n=1 Tax=Planifilum fimeticola TaxID=201975 RepID=A0A2T0LI67_9BACL|nr:hypothetical protein [Planifilum fimeticola]PRX42097.1 hypothetical protein CLV97_103112 [Planifilum fimeticola]
MKAVVGGTRSMQRSVGLALEKDQGRSLTAERDDDRKVMGL